MDADSTSENMLGVSRVLHRTTAEGPGLRSAVWVRGCSIRCPGCINPHLFEFAGPRTAIVDLAAEVIQADVEGLTLLGGEPFDQANGCATLAELVRSAGLGVMTFSGYSYESLVERGDITARLLAATDLLVDGPYRHEQPEQERSLVGSTNQRFIHLTDRYRDFNPGCRPNRIEFRVDAAGLTQIAGFMTRSQLRRFTEPTPLD